MKSLQEPNVASLCFGDGKFTVIMSDGEEITNPFTAETFPCLWYATPEERAFYEDHSGRSIHWPNLNETASINQLRKGMRSGYSERYLDEWRRDLREFRALPHKHGMTFTEWDLRRRDSWG